MRLASAVVGFAIAIALVGPAQTVQAASSDELASVELQGLRVAAVGYWPAPVDDWRCGSYLYSYSGVAPTSEFFVELIDAVSEESISSRAYGGEGALSASGTDELLVCGTGNVPSIRLRVSYYSDAGSQSAMSRPFTWGGSPPVIGSLPAGVGSATLGSNVIRTVGAWPAPQGQYNCVNVLVSGAIQPRDSTWQATTFRVVDPETRLVLATGDIAYATPDEPEATAAVEGCRPEEGIPLPRALSLQVMTADGLAIGQPFTWSTQLPTPSPGSPLPVVESAGTISIESAGLWPAPASKPALSPSTWSGSYLFRYEGLPVNGSTRIRLIDPLTRKVLGSAQLSRSEFNSSPPAAGVGEISLYDPVDPGRPFVVQIDATSDGTRPVFSESQTYVWDHVPATPPAGVRPPATVTLGPLSVTTEGSWTIPTYCGERTVKFTGLPNDSPNLTLRLIDVTTREVLAYWSPWGWNYSDQGTITFPVCARVTSDTRFAVQVSSTRLGVAESVPLRWATPVSKPTAPLGVKATLDPSNSSATVTWSPPASDGDDTITKYAVVTQPATAGCTWTTGPLQCPVGGLESGKTYFFYVYAYNSAGVSSASSPASLVVPTPIKAPGAPTSVVGTARDGAVSVSWRAPADNGSSSITGYTATASPGGQSCSTTGAVSCVVSGLINGTAYTFTVTASNAAGSSAPSAVSPPVTPGAIVSKPGAVANLKASPTRGALQVSWSPPPSTGGSFALSYQYQVGRGAWKTTSQTVVRVPGRKGARLTVHVRAVNEAGAGPAVTVSGVPK